jgi:hypothetical protein
VTGPRPWLRPSLARPGLARLESARPGRPKSARRPGSARPVFAVLGAARREAARDAPDAGGSDRARASAQCAAVAGAACRAGMGGRYWLGVAVCGRAYWPILAYTRDLFAFESSAYVVEYRNHYPQESERVYQLYSIRLPPFVSRQNSHGTVPSLRKVRSGTV